MTEFATWLDDADAAHPIPADVRDRICWLDEAVAAISESYGETYAEYRGECARFGDAWPGAALDLARMREALAAYEAELYHLESVWGQGRVNGPAVPLAPLYDDGDEPF